MEYPHTIKVGNKTLKVRKWKAKDRKAFKKEIIESEGNNSDVIITQNLVYNCIENKNIALTDEEIQYVFTQLRKLSVSETFEYTYKCIHCDYDNKEVLKIDDVSKPVFKEYKPIEVQGYKIELQDIKNKKFYEENKDQFDESKELAFRVKSINGDMSKSFNELVELFDDMDIDIFDKIYDQFQDMNFHVDNTHECTCKKCGKTTPFEFDEIPGFLPDSWYK